MRPGIRLYPRPLGLDISGGGRVQPGHGLVQARRDLGYRIHLRLVHVRNSPPQRTGTDACPPSGVNGRGFATELETGQVLEVLAQARRRREFQDL